MTNRKRNNFISYLKGVAIIAIILIHLMNWSNVPWLDWQKSLKDFFQVGVLFFIALVGTTIYVAYKDYDMKKLTKRLFFHGGKLIVIYFLYNIIKFFIYDFSKEPFYLVFSNNGKFTTENILGLKAFSVPITILFTIAVFFLISPLLFLAIKKFKNFWHAKLFICLLILILLFINYFIQIPSNIISDILYSNGYIMFPIILWLVPFLIGFLLGMIDFEKYKFRLFGLFGVLALLFYFIQVSINKPIMLEVNMFPIQLYYIAYSFFIMYLFIIAFYYLEKIKSKIIKFILEIVKILGDKSLEIYILHWIVIDISIWIFFPNVRIIWETVGGGLILYIGFKLWKKKLKDKIIVS